MSSCSVINNSVMSEPSLLSAAQAGEEWAFVELCTRHSKRVFNTIYSVTKNREDAEDALQDSMLRAYLHLDQFDGRSSFSTWFTRIGINSALMTLRKRRIRKESSIDSPVEGESWQTWQIADHTPGPEELYAGWERSQQLHRAIGGLPRTLRSVVEMGQMEGHSLKQIARNVGISVPATKSRLARAKQTLRREIFKLPSRAVSHP
jgi:RNA polymerase sigma factor (sigma-70 family)